MEKWFIHQEEKRRRLSRSVPVLGRIYTFHPNNLEWFYLGLLLHEAPGPSSFEYIKTINGIIRVSLQSACRALVLLEDNEHWNRTLKDAVEWESPHNLRYLFDIMLVFCNFQIKCYFGIIIRTVFQRISNENFVLLDVTVLKISLKDYGLPVPLRSIETNIGRAYLMEEDYDTRMQMKIFWKLNRYSILTNGWLTIQLSQAYRQETEPGVTGKTFLINLLLSNVRSKCDVLLP